MVSIQRRKETRRSGQGGRQRDDPGRVTLDAQIEATRSFAASGTTVLADDDLEAPDNLRGLFGVLRRHGVLKRPAAGISHAGIVVVYDSGVVDGRFYIVMEFVKGSPLRSEMEHRGVSKIRALGTGIMVLKDLAHAHAQGIIHRDLKPDNVLCLRRLLNPKPEERYASANEEVVALR